MATWSTRRKYGYLFIFVAAVVVLVGVPLFFLFYKAPTCSDGKQNGSERGIDCGGVCARLCPADYAVPRALWSYAVRVVPGVYNALAYVQNPNPSVQANGLSYLFKLYDDQGILVAQRTGTVFVPPGQKFAVFEGGIETGYRIPVQTTFEFTGVPDWRPGTLLPKLSTTNVDLVQGPSPRATVTVRNDSATETYSGVNAFIILYNKDNNRVSFSKTVIDSIPPGGSEILNYTWPEAFPEDVVRSEVLFSK